jgi:Tfp pilus assembly protein PilF
VEQKNANDLHLLGLARVQAGQIDEALGLIQKAIAIAPTIPEFHNNLGNVLMRAGRVGEAVDSFRRAIELNPRSAKALNNLANALKNAGRDDEAIASYRRAISIEPELAIAHWNLATLLLSMGNFEDGWKEFEWRLKVAAKRWNREFAQPRWDGNRAADKTLLLYTEGGYGDAIQFVRFVRQVRPLLGRLVLECQSPLVRLFESVDGIDALIPRGGSLPTFDFHLPLQSLPYALGIRLDTIPRSTPYLKPPNDLVTKWKSLVSGKEKMNVGLCWAGTQYSDGPDRRSRDLAVFSSLFEVEGVRFFNLQVGPEGRQTPPVGTKFVDLTSELTDFADAAALAMNLDLIISIDTSIAHLAGSLGRPVWVLLPSRSEFRWLRERTDSPWYPTMRLFRQHSAGDWTRAVLEMQNALQQFSRK